jgi:two-component system phosphate regulon response regulator PhoB
MSPKSVLIVEDEAEIRELLCYNLAKEGFQVSGVASGQQAILTAEAKNFDLVLLDLLLPDLDGLTVCRRLKAAPRTRSTPVIMLTAKGEEADVVSGLNVGADDYVTKPFSPKVLIARIRAVLRRHDPGEAETFDGDDEGTLQIRELTIHPGRHEVLLNGEPIELTFTEFRILRFLARKPGWVFTRQQILDGIHGDNYAITDRAVDVQIVGLRKKLGSAGHLIETVRGVGYRFKE